MHARQLVELAAIVAAHGPVLVRGTERLSAAALERYWIASKSRLDRWGRSLKSFSQSAAGAELKRRRSRWPFVRGVLEEIITGEMLTRVWAAVLCAHDQHHFAGEAEPVARSVLIGQLEARHRVLTLLVRGPGIDAEAAVKLNHLRRRTERWSDLLIGYLTALHDVSEFAPDPSRARDFGEDLRYGSDLSAERKVWPLVLGSLRAAFCTGLCTSSPNADLNREIASSILACFPAELFDSTGLFRSLWMLRLTNVTNDAQGMIEELLSLEQPARVEEWSESSRPEARVRRFGR